MKKSIFLLIVVILTAIANANATCATCVTDQEESWEPAADCILSDAELREFALNGFPLSDVLEYSGYTLNLKTMDKDVLIMLIENCYDGCFGSYRYSATTPGTINIITGIWQMQILDRPDAEEIMAAILRSRGELYIGTVKKMLGDPCISTENVNAEWNGGNVPPYLFVVYPDKVMPFVDDVISVYQKYAGKEIPKKKPCLITRDQNGKIIKRAEYGEGVSARSVATPKQIELFYKLTGRNSTEETWVWDLVVERKL